MTVTDRTDCIGDTEVIQDDFGNVEDYLKNILYAKTYARYFYYILSQSTEISQIVIGMRSYQVKKYYGQPKLVGICDVRTL